MVTPQALREALFDAACLRNRITPQDLVRLGDADLGEALSEAGGPSKADPLIVRTALARYLERKGG